MRNIYWRRHIRCLSKEEILQAHQRVFNYVHQHFVGRFVGSIKIVGVVLGLLCVCGAFVTSVPGIEAKARTVCSRNDSTYVVVGGDTLSEIAYDYGTNWPLLASYNHIANPNLIYIDQVICVPGQGSVSRDPYRIHHIPSHFNISPKVRVPSHAKASPPVRVPVSTPAPVNTPAPEATAPPVQGGSSIEGMIDQVFGAYGPGAIRVAQCESGLNPSAVNPAGVYAGLFQILYPSTWDSTSEAGSSPYDAWANIAAAHEIFVRDGYSWREWTCQP